MPSSSIICTNKFCQNEGCKQKVADVMWLLLLLSEKNDRNQLSFTLSLKSIKTCQNWHDLSQEVLSQHRAQPRKSDTQLFHGQMLGEPVCLLLDRTPVWSASNRYIMVTLCRYWRYCSMVHTCIFKWNKALMSVHIYIYSDKIEIVIDCARLILMECHNRKICKFHPGNPTCGQNYCQGTIF